MTRHCLGGPAGLNERVLLKHSSVFLASSRKEAVLGVSRVVSDRCVTRWYRGRLQAESLCYNLSAALGNGSYVVRSGVLTMLSSKRKLSLIAGLAALSLFAAGVGCTGFFVNQPNSIAVTQAGASTFSVAVGAPKQVTATATYNRGTKIATNSATSSSSTSCATVSTT